MKSQINQCDLAERKKFIGVYEWGGRAWLLIRWLFHGKSAKKHLGSQPVYILLAQRGERRADIFKKVPIYYCWSEDSKIY